MFVYVMLWLSAFPAVVARAWAADGDEVLKCAAPAVLLSSPAAASHVSPCSAVVSRRLRSVGESVTRAYIRGNHLSSTTCLTHAFFKGDQSCRQGTPPNYCLRFAEIEAGVMSTSSVSAGLWVPSVETSSSFLRESALGPRRRRRHMFDTPPIDENPSAADMLKQHVWNVPGVCEAAQKWELALRIHNDTCLCIAHA